jgi:hypothetical protein
MEMRGQLHTQTATILVHGTHNTQNSEDKLLQAYNNNYCDNAHVIWNTWQSEYWNTVHFRLVSEGFWEKPWRISNES